MFPSFHWQFKFCFIIGTTAPNSSESLILAYVHALLYSHCDCAHELFPHAGTQAHTEIESTNF